MQVNMIKVYVTTFLHTHEYVLLHILDLNTHAGNIKLAGIHICKCIQNVDESWQIGKNFIFAALYMFRDGNKTRSSNLSYIFIKKIKTSVSWSFEPILKHSNCNLNF